MPDKNISIFAGESFMISRSIKRLRESLHIENETINTVYYERTPKADELFEACMSVPFMSAKRMVTIGRCDLLTVKGSAEEAQKVAAFIGRIPDTTVLVLCTEEAIDKRRVLYKCVKSIGEVREFSRPSVSECIDFIIGQAKESGAVISKSAASDLVLAVGCDYFSLENETAKLAVFSGFKEITRIHVAECASKSLEYNIYEIHGLFMNKQAERAKSLLGDILRSERPEAVIGLFARKFRDLYKVKSMLDARFPAKKIATQVKLSGFITQILIGESKRFTRGDLQNALSDFADLDYAIKSGERDAELALTKTLISIYQLI